MIDLKTWKPAAMAALKAAFGERAVGFTCGRAELAAWPAYELYQFEHGTEVWLGDLHTLLPEYDEDDIRMGTRVSVANLYHMVNHTYLTTRDLDETARADALKPLLKAFFFSLQIVHAVRTGIFAPTKRQLLTELTDEDERTLLRHAMPSNAVMSVGKANVSNDDIVGETLYALLQAWCSRTLIAIR